MKETHLKKWHIPFLIILIIGKTFTLLAHLSYIKNKTVIKIIFKNYDFIN